jgi:hypothetical protein
MIFMKKHKRSEFGLICTKKSISTFLWCNEHAGVRWNCEESWTLKFIIVAFKVSSR